MAIIVEDQFTEASAVALTAHTPSPTGTSWTEEDHQNTAVINDNATNDYIVASATQTAAGQVCSAQPNPSVAEYDIEWQCKVADTGTATRQQRLIARWVDVNNHYGFRVLPDGHASNAYRLYKVVSGTLTELATVDGTTAVDDVFVFEIRDATKRVLKNGSEILTTSDNELTGAGKAGVGMGRYTLVETTGNMNVGAMAWDNFKVTEVSAAVDHVTYPAAVAVPAFPYHMEV